MKTPQAKPSWATGIYVGDGTVVPEKTSDEWMFDVWLQQCDKVVFVKLGVGLDDLADADWRGYYEDEMHPRDACDCAFDDMWSDDMPSELWYG